MENFMLSAADFNGRLNKGIFTNIEKGISQEEFRSIYPTSNHIYVNKGRVKEFIEKAYELTGGEIIEGGFNDTEECRNILEQMRNQINILKGAKVQVGEEIVDIFAIETEGNTNEIKKAKGSDDNNIEKGVIYDLISYDTAFIEFNKKGSELKEKLAVKKSEINQACIEAKSKLLNMEKDLLHVPTEKYEDDDEFCNFHYELCWNDGHNVKFNESDSGMLSKEEAEMNRNWNDCCYKYRELKREMKAIELLESELEDNKNYKLTARQMLNLGF